ncbi:MAG: MFS transporter [Novosphingobium sp.]|nr:MFS transporter [Novosphingobium sp.]
MSQPADKTWWRGNSAYQWLVFVVAGGAWLFDNLDQRLFSLARVPAISNLLRLPSSNLAVQDFAKVVTALFLIGWGLGGLTLGAMGDRFGRVRLLVISVLIYSVGTGATALAQSADQFLVLRVIAGFGIGGVFGLAVAIIAENFTGSTRVAMLAGLQVLSVVGNIGAALTKMGFDGLAGGGTIPQDQVWRWLFGIGTLPIVLAVAAALWLRESEAWLTLKRERQLPKGPLGSYAVLLADKRERRNLAIGAMLALSGVVGLWGIGEYATDLQDAVFTAYYKAHHPLAEAKQLAQQARNLAYLLQMIGAATGMALFTWVANVWGRRPAFMIGFAAAGIITAGVYGWMETPADAYWMIPLMGVAQFSVFAGFSIYLPELFGARSRGTGVSFCYNLGRFAAAAGGFVSAALTTKVFGGYPSPLPLRYAAMVMCVVFAVGVFAAWLGPETRGKELVD